MVCKVWGLYVAKNPSHDRLTSYILFRDPSGCKYTNNASNGESNRKGNGQHIGNRVIQGLDRDPSAQIKLPTLGYLDSLGDPCTLLCPSFAM